MVDAERENESREKTVRSMVDGACEHPGETVELKDDAGLEKNEGREKAVG